MTLNFLFFKKIKQNTISFEFVCVWWFNLLAQKKFQCCEDINYWASAVEMNRIFGNAMAMLFFRLLKASSGVLSLINTQSDLFLSCDILMVAKNWDFCLRKKTILTDFIEIEWKFTRNRTIKSGLQKWCPILVEYIFATSISLFIRWVWKKRMIKSAIWFRWLISDNHTLQTRATRE